jgi:hypothetical protein
LSRVVGGISLGFGMIAWTAAQTVSAVAGGLCGGVNGGMGCHTSTPTLWGPDIMMAGGLALLIAPAFWSNDPVSSTEKAALARDAGLRVGWNVAAAPSPDGQGGTVLVSGRF